MTYVFTLTVTDDQSSTPATDTVNVTVIAPPLGDLVASAGDDKDVDSGQTVTLDGSGTASDSVRTVSYLWTRTGTEGTLAGGTTLTPVFTAPALTPGAADVTYVFTLTVTDDQSSTPATDTVNVTVTAPPLGDLVASAGDDKDVDSGQTVTLDGSGTASDSDRTVSYLWTRTGTEGTLADGTTLTPVFTAPALTPGATDVTYVFTLTVTDDQSSTPATDTVNVTVTAPPLGDLVASAGDDKDVDSGQTVTLDGSGTASDSVRTVSYLWTRTGTEGTLAGGTTLTPVFTAPALTPGAADVTYVFTLTVTDDQSSTPATDTVNVTVTAPPLGDLVASAGDDKDVDSGQTVTLDGSGTASDSDRTVSYLWTRTGTEGTLAGGTTLTPVFTAPGLTPGAADVTYVFTLTVTDDQSSTPATDTVNVTVTAPPLGDLVASAGDDKDVDSGQTVTLDGSGTGSDSVRTVSYLWTRSGTGGTLTGGTTLTPSFTAPALTPGATDVTYVFTLTVSDDQGSTQATDTVEITVTAPPVVSIESPNAGPDETIQAAPGETVTLVGSATEIDGTPFVSFLWRRTGGTGDPTDVVLIGANTATLTLMFTAETAQASFVANTPEPGDADVTHIFTLTVTDSDGASHTSDPVTVIVSAVAQVERARADDPIPRPVGQFLETRATSLINNQPGLSSFLELDGPTPGGGGSGSFTFQATDGRLSLDGGFLHNGVWGKVSGSRASSESGDTKSVTKSVLGSFGIHRKYSEHFLAGAMLQFDLSDHDRAGQVGTTHTIDGTGWLAGPYFAARHDTRPVYFEGRLLYGQSDNDIRFIDPALGVRTGSFDTRRLLAQIRVEGEIAMSGRNHGDDGNDGGADGPRLRPYADARWIEDRAEAFTDNIGNRVPGQKVSIGQLELGSNVEVPVAVRTGAMTLTGGLGLVWSNTEGDYITSDSGGRGRGEIGFSYDLDDNVRIEFESFYDGIGSSRYEGYGLSLSAEMKF